MSVCTEESIPVSAVENGSGIVEVVQLELWQAVKVLLLCDPDAAFLLCDLDAALKMSQGERVTEEMSKGAVFVGRSGYRDESLACGAVGNLDPTQLERLPAQIKDQLDKRFGERLSKRFEVNIPPLTQQESTEDVLYREDVAWVLVAAGRLLDDTNGQIRARKRSGENRFVRVELKVGGRSCSTAAQVYEAFRSLPAAEQPEALRRLAEHVGVTLRSSQSARR